MPVEAELTAILRDPVRVRAELDKRAVPEPGIYADTYYDRPDHRMDTTGYELRVRTITAGQTGRTVLTYKEPAVTDWRQARTRDRGRRSRGHAHDLHRPRPG
jgi:adenylate cyclase class 2